MQDLLKSRLGKLKVLCSLTLFSDAICLKKLSAAEHGFTQIMLAISLLSKLNLSKEEEAALLELCIFSELPKAYMGDPSYYLRSRHADVKKIYETVQIRLWEECETVFEFKTTRHIHLLQLQEIFDAFSAKQFIWREVLLGNSFFKLEIKANSYETLRQQSLANQLLCQKNELSKNDDTKIVTQVTWPDVFIELDKLHSNAEKALFELGVGEYSATFLGMVEKLKEHFRYKGWNYLYAESVGEHTYQVVFLCRLLAERLKLSAEDRVSLYILASFHDLPEGYASDVIYPVKTREKDLGNMHQKIEDEVTSRVSQELGVTLSTCPKLKAIVDICDRFSAQIYFEREQRAGNKHFEVASFSWDKTKLRYLAEHKVIFDFLDLLWQEYLAPLK